jgi:hypothetical protein
MSLPTEINAKNAHFEIKFSRGGCLVYRLLPSFLLSQHTVPISLMTHPGGIFKIYKNKKGGTSIM